MYAIRSYYGAGPGLTLRKLGDKSGQETVTLIPNQLPNHSHYATATLHAQEEANVEDPANNFIAGTGSPIFGNAADIELNSNSVEVEIQPAGENRNNFV